jgi:hypothetical protein
VQGWQTPIRRLEVTTQLTSVFAQQIQRDVVGAGDVHRPELGRGAHVQHSWDVAGFEVAGVEPVAQGGDVKAGGYGADGGLCHETSLMWCVGR